MATLKDLTGKKIGRWTVLKKLPSENNCTIWKCICDCGTTKKVFATGLLSGESTSCGCYNREQVSKAGFKHGLTNTRIYHIWENVVGRGTGRCHKKQYYDKGLFVCERWKSFVDFLTDMGHPPTDKHVIDRIDNTKGYSKENCRWADRALSSRNKLPRGVKHGIHLVTIADKTLCLIDWCSHFNIKYDTVIARIKRGWEDIKALTEPLKYRKNIQ